MIRIQTDLEWHEVARIYDFLRIGSNGRDRTHDKVKRVLDGSTSIRSPRFSLAATEPDRDTGDPEVQHISIVGENLAGEPEVHEVILADDLGRLLAEKLAEDRGKQYRLYKDGDLIGTYRPGGWDGAGRDAGGCPE